MKINKYFSLSSVLLTTLFVSACSTTSFVTNNEGIPHVIASSSNKRPLWIDNIHKYQTMHKNNVYFVGEATHQLDDSLGRDVAYANAMRNVANKVENDVHNLFVQATVTDSDTSHIYKQQIQQRIEDATLQTASVYALGASPDTYYWQEYEVGGNYSSPTIFRNIHVLVSMSQKAYKKTVEKTLDRVKNTVKNSDAKNLVEDMKKRWLKTERKNG